MQNLQSQILKVYTLAALRIAVALLVTASAFAQTSSGASDESNTAALLEKHAALATQLAQNQYRRQLFLESSESANRVSGSAYAVLDSPLTTVSTAFKSPRRWCEVLILHLNTKYCRAATDTNPSTLEVDIGKKTPQALTDTFGLEFSYRVAAASPTYLAVLLHADKGPLSTSDYRIELQVVPLPEGKSFLFLRYSYGYGLTGRLAMQTYLSTVGHGKIGFSQIKEGQNVSYIGGMRGAVERNTMRYYLAIEAYLASLNQPPAQQFNSRLRYWFDATEEYSRQLHEIDRPSYLAMKKDEYQRQQAD